MKKVIRLACLLICVILFCTSCAQQMSFKKFYANYEYENSYPLITSKFTELTALDGMAFESATDSEILVFEHRSENSDEETVVQTKFYNAKTASFIISLKEESVVNYKSFSVYGNTFIAIVEKTVTDDGETKTTTYKTNVYNSKGEIVATMDDYAELSLAFTVSGDLFRFDGKIYRVAKDGAVTLVTDSPFFGSIPSFDFRTESFYYDIASDFDSVCVYDKDLVSVFYWELPYEADESSITFLSENRILVQMLDKVPEGEKDYDIYDAESDTRYKLTSMIVNTKNGNEKTVKLDYLVEYRIYSKDIVTTDDTTDFLPKKVKNLFYVTMIENKKVLTSSEATKLVSLDGKNASILIDAVSNLDSLPMPIAEDRYLYTADSGESFIMDSTGKIIGKINSSVYNNAQKNEKYIVLNGKIYNYNLEMVYDCEANDMTVAFMLGNSIILKKTDDSTYYLYSEEGVLTSKIKDFYSAASYSSYSSYKQLYVAYDDEENEYTFYNEKGLSLDTLENVAYWEIIYTFENNESFILRVRDMQGKVSFVTIGK